MTDPTSKPAAGTGPWLEERFDKVAEKAAENLIWIVVLAAASAGGTVFGAIKSALDHRDVIIGLSAAVLAIALISLGSGLYAQVRRRLVALEAQVADAERQLESALQEADQRVRLSEYKKQLLYDALESIQLAIASDEQWDLDGLVERGVLGPARGLLTRRMFEDVRFSVLVPREDRVHWRMRWAVGHRPEGVHSYHREIDKTLAGIAFRKGEFVVSQDVLEDDRFERHPKATRNFRSLVSVPLRIGETVVGALTVVSTLPNAFNEADLSFIRVIGAVLDVLLASEYDVERLAEFEGDEELEEVENGEEG